MMKQLRSVLGAVLVATVVAGVSVRAGREDHSGRDVIRAAVPQGAIKHVMVIDLENEDFASTFGASSPAVYLNATLLSQGELVTNYFATSHVSLGNYVAQVSGQGPTLSVNNDCLNLASLSSPPVVGAFTDVLPGTDALDAQQFPGQVVGDGCVFPGPGATAHGAMTIGDQLDALARLGSSGRLTWREYAEDMGDDTTRDYGTPDPLGGADCAHPPIGGSDHSNSAA